MAVRNIYGLVLAAGQSRRMGRPKQFLPYGDGTIIEAVVQSMLDSSADGLVVAANPDVAQFLNGMLPERCFVAVNRDPRSEMLASVQLGLRRMETEFRLHDMDAVAIVLGDQPQVGAGVLTTCIEAYRLPRNPPGILIATYGGRRGHPTVFAYRILKEVLDWPPDRRLNELAREHAGEVRQLAITTTPMPLDVNTPQDYDRLKGDGGGFGVS